MSMVKTTILLSSIMVLGACTSDAQIIPKKVSIGQLQHSWKLTHVDNIKLAKIINASLTIDGDNKSSGNLGCNNFFGKVTFNNNQLHINNTGVTRMKCDDLANDVEVDVSQVLNEWADVMIDNKVLIVSNKKHSLTYVLADEVVK